MATPTPSQEQPDLSLSLGGPLYQMLRRHSTRPIEELLRRQAALAVLICWLPLAVLSVVQDQFVGGVGLSFLRDIETHARFLVSLPVLIMGEAILKRRVRPIVQRFVERHLVSPEELPKFYAAVQSAERVNNSVIAEIALVVFVFTVGVWAWRQQIGLDVASWYGSRDGGHIHLTMAGYWLAFVSVPIFQFILLRWYMQFVIWFWFLFRVSRLKLLLRSMHPDRAGGIGFLGGSSMGFAPLLFAHSALLSGQIASRIFHHGGSLIGSKTTFVCYLGLSVAAVVSPLLMFSPQLILAKRRGSAKYGTFASGYVTEFDRKWLSSEIEDAPLKAGEDMQGLADLGNSFAAVRRMRPMPFSTDDMMLLLVATAAPFLPLLLTIMPIEQLVMRAFKAIF